MKRRIAGIGVGLALAIGAVGIGAPAAALAAACPNEAFRAGPSAQLAECRAYEQVTPVDKEGGAGVDEFAGALSTSDGDGIWFHSLSAYAGAQANTLQNAYVSKRSTEAWSTQFNGLAQQTKLSLLVNTSFAVSDDLGLALVASEEAFAPGAYENGSNMYLMDLRTGSLRTVAALPDFNAFKREWANLGGADPFVGASTDWSRIFISSPRVLAPGGVEKEQNLYEYSDGQIRLAAAEAYAAGTIPVTEPNASEDTPNVVSTDGTRLYYVKGERLYLRQLGGETLLVSEDEAGTPLSGTVFIGASPDGGIAFFKSADGHIYRFEAGAPAGSRITDITPLGPGGSEPQVINAATKGDGTAVYFAAKGLLTPDAEPRPESPFGNGYSLYAWQGAPGQAGGLRYIGKSEVVGEFSGPTALTVSQNGRYFAFESRGRVTPDAIDGSVTNCAATFPGFEPDGRCPNVFLYSLDSDQVACASCSATPTLGLSRIGGKELRRESRSEPKAVSDDGTVFFDTPDPLLPRDSNNAFDVYSWRAGQLRLISTGTDPAPSTFIEATADGSNAFFQTQQSLVGQDNDTSVDLYDARIDGGLPQGAAAPTPPCASETGCRPGIAPTSPSASPPSAATNGGGTCLALKTRAREAKRRSGVLARRARKADGKRAKVLRRGAAREARLGKQLGRKADSCTEGGR